MTFIVGGENHDDDDDLNDDDDDNRLDITVMGDWALKKQFLYLLTIKSVMMTAGIVMTMTTTR